MISKLVQWIDWELDRNDEIIRGINESVKIYFLTCYGLLM